MTQTVRPDPLAFLADEFRRTSDATIGRLR